MSGVTQDRFLDGRVMVRQPENGFRAGLDAVMLAAAVPARPSDDVLELGAGAGTASLCLAARVGGCTITGVELDPVLVELANANASSNGLTARTRFVAADAFDLPADLRRSFHHVFCNPPFHGEDGEVSPDAGRALALQDGGRLADWLDAGMKRTASNGTFTAILRADRLGEALGALPEKGVAMLPLWPKASEPAKRVIVAIRKGSRAGSRLFPGLVLHESNGRYTEAADAILRGGKAFDLG